MMEQMASCPQCGLCTDVFIHGATRFTAETHDGFDVILAVEAASAKT